MKTKTKIFFKGKMMKKILSLLCSIILLCFLTSCVPIRGNPRISALIDTYFPNYECKNKK